jgi:predicted N-acetyltransferase YhbS
VPTPIEVRPARQDEHAAVGALTARVYEDEGWAAGGYLDVLRDVAARARQADVLVALDDGRLVGAVTVATAGGPYAEQAGEGEAVLRMLVVDPAARGRGAGRALVQSCLDRARDAGCTAVLLSSQPAMASAHRIYAAAGFVRRPEGDWSPEPGVDLQAYRLDL